MRSADKKVRLSPAMDCGGIVASEVRPVNQPPVPKTELRPEIRRALMASWNRNEEAYRYLGR